MISDSEMLAMSYQQYDQFLKENPVSTNQQDMMLVKRVGAKIQHSVEQYMANNNLSGFRCRNAIATLPALANSAPSLS